MIERMAQNPWAVGIACAVGAVGLGIFYMTAAGAPVRYSLMIGAAWRSGWSCSPWWGGRPSAGRRPPAQS